VDEQTAFRGLLAWTSLFGVISFELFGHLVGSVTEPATFSSAALEVLVDELGLPG
jgi:hypothetical protein